MQHQLVALVVQLVDHVPERRIARVGVGVVHAVPEAGDDEGAARNARSPSPPAAPASSVSLGNELVRPPKPSLHPVLDRPRPRELTPVAELVLPER